jgi:NAD(P) transhydrogenase subunit alpha
MVQAMRPGSVIVDLAVEQGGNCELSEPGQEVVRHSVLILGHANLPATMPHDASTLYARNLFELVRQLLRDGRLVIDRSDAVIRDTLLTHEGQVTHAPTANLLEGEGK